MKLNAKIVALACSAMLVCAAMVGISAGVAQAATYDADQVTWVQKSEKVYAKASSKKLTGMNTIGSKDYYFDKKGVQRTGWRKVKGEYYFFKIGLEAKGCMVKGKVINGVELDKEGKAVQTDAALSELNILIKANKLLDTLVKPTWTKSQKLKAIWKYMTNRTLVVERSYRKFSNVKNWHQAFALDVFDRHGGSCYSMGAAMAYLANAAGYKKVEIVSSGGHGWARIDGLVYDPEWSYWHAGEWYAIHGSYGGVNYSVNSTYVVKIAPNSKAGGAVKGKNYSSTLKSNSKTGLTKKNGNYYFIKSDGSKLKNSWKKIGKYKYYFGPKGKAYIGCKKVGKSYYVFNAKARLSMGSGDHFRTVKGVKYLVTKSGKAKTGWTANNTKRYYNGQIQKGIWFWGGKFYAFDSQTGIYDTALTSALRAAAVVDQDATALKELLGTPKSTVKADACRPGPTGLTGQDVIYEYDHLTLCTYLDPNGIETFVEADKN